VVFLRVFRQVIIATSIHRHAIIFRIRKRIAVNMGYVQCNKSIVLVHSAHAQTRPGKGMSLSRHGYLWLFLPLLVLTAIDATSTYFLAARGLRTSPKASLFGTMVYRLTITGWVYLDRRSRALNLPFEFDAFMFIAWIIVLLYYLYRTRGWRGLLLAAAIGTPVVTPAILTVLARL
jgi:hypothetical protein